MKRLFILFFLIMFVIGTDTFLISPLLPNLRQSFGVSKEVSGWMVGAYALGYACFALLSGPLSDGWNRKKVMMYGLVSFAISTILCGTATGFTSMVCFRLLAGISAAFAAPQVWAAIATLIPPTQMVKAMGIATAGLAVSQALGVPIGSYLAVTNWSTPFFVIGVGSLLLVVLCKVLLPDLPPALQNAPSTIAQRYRILLHNSRARLSFLAYFVFQLGVFSAFTFIGTWLTDRYGLNSAGVGTVMIFFGLGNLVGNFSGSSIVQASGRSRALIVGSVLLAVIYLCISFVPNLTYVKIAFFLIALLGGVLFPLMMSLLQTLSTSARGTISSLASSAMYGASTLGAVLAGEFYVKVDGFFSICIFTAACFLIAVMVFMKSGILPSTTYTNLRLSRKS